MPVNLSQPLDQGLRANSMLDDALLFCYNGFARLRNAVVSGEEWNSRSRLLLRYASKSVQLSGYRWRSW